MNLAALGLVMSLAAEPAPDAGPSVAPAYPQEGLKRPILLTPPPHVPTGLVIRGRVMVKCRVLVAGLLEDCAVLTFDGNPADPRLVGVIRSWAATARLEPAKTSEGKPVEVPYVFNFNFR